MTTRTFEQFNRHTMWDVIENDDDMRAITDTFHSLYQSGGSSLVSTMFHCMTWRALKPDQNQSYEIVQVRAEPDMSICVAFDFERFAEITLKTRRSLFTHCFAHIFIGHFDLECEKEALEEFPPVIWEIAKEIVANKNTPDFEHMREEMTRLFVRWKVMWTDDEGEFWRKVKSESPTGQIEPEMEAVFRLFRPWAWSYAETDYACLYDPTARSSPDRTTSEVARILLEEFAWIFKQTTNPKQQDSDDDEEDGEDETAGSRGQSRGELDENDVKKAESYLRAMSEQLRDQVQTSDKNVWSDEVASSEDLANETMKRLFNDIDTMSDGELEREKQAGNLPGGAAEYLDAVFAPMPITLDKVVYDAQTRFQVANGRRRRSRLRRSFQCPMVSELNGSVHRTSSCWVVLIDTSASMVAEDLAPAHPIIQGLTRKGATVYQCQADTDVSLELTKMPPGQTLTEFFGRGGTAFMPSLNYLTGLVEQKKYHIDAVLYLTDGCNYDVDDFKLSDEPPYDLIVGLTVSGMSVDDFYERCPPWMSKAHIKTVADVSTYRRHLKKKNRY